MLGCWDSGKWDDGRVGWWDSGMVGWWDNGMVGRWDNGMMGWWDGGRDNGMVGQDSGKAMLPGFHCPVLITYTEINGQ